MLYVWSVMLVVLNGVWLALVGFGLPGNWLIVISTCLFAWWRAEDEVFSIYTLIAITVLAVLGELIEFFGGASGARKAGASWRGSIGAIIGAVAGAIIGTFTIPVALFGTLMGACIGAGLGAWGLELTAGKQMKESIHSGIGAGLGELLGITAKFAIGVLIWVVVAVAVFWP
ncbi:MAG TPA: DUF456 domain-containing protein [Sedimentisphaerales bacterium]|nr:DUF456 domain-containing protein [Sedimentisphaerales bacterium]